MHVTLPAGTLIALLTELTDYYYIVVTQATVVCMIYTTETQGPHARGQTMSACLYVTTILRTTSISNYQILETSYK